MARPAMSFPGKYFYRGVLVVAVILFGYYVFGVVVIFKYGGMYRDFGFRAAAKNGSWRVTEVDPAGPVAGSLEVGDVFLAVNGDPRVQTFGPAYKFRIDPPEGDYDVRLNRGGAPFDLTLEARVSQNPRHLVGRLPLLAASLSFYVISIVVGLYRPSERMPQLMVEAGFAVAAVLLIMCISPSRDFLQGWEAMLLFVLMMIPPFHLLLGVRFFYWFTSPGQTQAPAKRPRAHSGGNATATTLERADVHDAITADRRAESQPPRISAPGRLWSVAYIALWVWGVLIYIPGIATKIVRLPGLVPAPDFVVAHYWFFGPYWSINDRMGNAFGMAALLMMIGVLAGNYGRIEQLDQRRRVKWIVYGTAIGVIPPAVVWLGNGILDTAGYTSITSSRGFRLLFSLATAMPMFVPFTLGHAVAKHRVMDVDVVVRRGIQYMLAKNVLRSILLLPIIGLVYTVASNPDRTVVELFIERSSTFYIFLIVTGSVSLKYRGQLREWIDRKFFREKYDQEQILLELIEKVKECDSLTTISEMVCSEAVAALHPECIFVFYRDPRRPDFALGYSSGGEGRNLRIPEESALLRFVEGQSQPIEVDAHGLAEDSRLAEEERSWLDELGVELIVPMRGSILPLAGILFLGEKKSQEPYSDSNKRLLQAIASQVAMMCENMWLKERVDQETHVRLEVLAHLERERVNLVKECPTCGRCFDRSEDVCSDDRSELTLTLPVERTIDERYRLERVLGKGGMGAVYAATDERLSRPVAVKIMMGHLFGQKAAMRRFEREARASANLNHPNIIAVHDYGTIGSGGAYLVMELIRGVTVRAELQRRGRVAPCVAAEWFDQVLGALSAAHGAGVIHRDLKPENLMIVEPEAETDASAPLIKVLDFGLAKVRMIGVESQSLTVPGTVMGTCAYMSPEQLSGSEVDERTDLFSIGVMMAESITGERPFQGDTAAQILYAMLHSAFQLKGKEEPIRTLEAALQKSMSKNREDRYSTGPEMRQALIPVLRRCPVIQHY